MKIALGFPTLDRQEACEECIDQARKVGFEHIIPISYMCTCPFWENPLIER